jgi:dephospho-CoA kinase
MLRIGLTGGIGSGKSTVARIFEVLGIPVYYADKETRRLMNEDKALIKEIEKHFGPGSYTTEGLNRSYISSIVFNDPSKLALLNSLTHPITIQHASKWMEKQTTSYVLKEAALIFESGSNKGLDYVVGVFAPKELRIKRVMERDNVPREEILKKMEQQMNEDEKMKLCDFVITNDEQQLMIPQVISLHEKFLQLSKRKQNKK